MPEKAPKATRQELETAFEKAVQFIGKHWLEAQFEEHFKNNKDIDLRTKAGAPLLLNHYRAAAVFLGYKDEIFPEVLPEDKPTKAAVHFTNLGNFLNELEQANIVTADGEISNNSLNDIFTHRLRNPDEYKETAYEILTGSIYAQQNYEILFIDEHHTKAPDLQIPFQDTTIQIECKRCGTPGNPKTRSGIYESLLNKLTSVAHTPTIILFELDRTLTSEEAQTIDQYLPEELNRRTETTIEAPFGTMHILTYMEYTRTKRIPAAGLEADEQLKFFYDYYIQPAIYAKTGEKLDLYADFERATIEPENNKAAVSSTQIEYFDPMFVGIQKDSQDDFVTPAVRQFDEARKKFDTEHPNILHIDIPYLDRFSQTEFITLHQRLRGKLNVNQRISAIVLTTEHIECNEEDALNYAIVIGAEENLDPYVPIPAEFEIPGYSLEEMRSNPLLDH
jgi:hypothetical protein